MIYNQIPNSLAIPSHASFVIRAFSKEDVIEAVALAEKEGLPLIPLGDGTNIVPQSEVKAVVLLLDLKGIEINGEIFKIAAGENWDDVVKLSVEKGFRGLEALSAIPGRAGAAPIQNIGAYGSEIGTVIERVEVLDRTKKEFVYLSKEECQFGYRTSLFKKNPDDFIVISIELRLSKAKPKMPDYKDVKKYFSDRENTSPNLQEIREAIIEIRKNKLPDPKLIPNAGSFFTNPIVDREILSKFPEMPNFPFENKLKIPAGWLIEQTGFKGAKIGQIEIYKNNALVLTNPNRANFNDVISAQNTIQKAVFDKFGVLLEKEPRIIYEHL